MFSGNVEARGQACIRDGTPRACQAEFQFVEQRGFVIPFIFALQSLIDRVEQRQRPVLLKESFRCERVDGFAPESGFGIASVERDDLSAAALSGASLLPLIH